ncbi:MAG: flagellar export chaperone FlgN [Planctomycetota bacterium]
MTSLTTETLADLIDKRYRCLTQLRDLGKKQRELIRVGDMGALLRLISTKNQLIAALQSIEQGLSPFHDQDPDQRNWHSPDAKTRCKQLATDCQALLNEVMEMERQNEQRMVARRDEVAAQLQAAQAANTARSAYQSHQQSQPQGPHQTSNTGPMPPIVTAQGSQLDLQSEA